MWNNRAYGNWRNETKWKSEPKWYFAKCCCSRISYDWAISQSTVSQSTILQVLFHFTKYHISLKIKHLKNQKYKTSVGKGSVWLPFDSNVWGSGSVVHHFMFLGLCNWSVSQVFMVLLVTGLIFRKEVLKICKCISIFSQFDCINGINSLLLGGLFISRLKENVRTKQKLKLPTFN